MARAAAYARDVRPGPTENVVPGYGTLDLGGAWRFGKGAELRLLLRNITDKDYPATPDSKAVLAPGRTAAVVLSAGF